MIWKTTGRRTKDVAGDYPEVVKRLTDRSQYMEELSFPESPSENAMSKARDKKKKK